MRKLLLLFILIFPAILSAEDTNTRTGNIVDVPAEISSWFDAEIAKIKRKSLLGKDEFFTRDTAKLVGYIKGYHPDLGFNTGIVQASNDYSLSVYPCIANIQADGRFEVTIPMSHPKILSIDFNKTMLSFYLEPGQTLGLYFDWNTFVSTDGFSQGSNTDHELKFLGPLATINKDIKSIKLVKSNLLSYKGVTQEMMTAELNRLIDTNRTIILKAERSMGLLSDAIAIQKMEMFVDAGYKLMDYVSSKEGLHDTVTSDYYDFLQSMPLNDQRMAVSPSFMLFINRLEFSKPVFWKSLRSSKGWENPSFQEKWRRRDSLMRSELNLPSSFAYEVFKVRHFSRDLPDMDKDEAYKNFAVIKQGISYPFLLDESKRMLLKRFGTMQQPQTKLKPDGILKLPEQNFSQKEVHGTTSVALPEGKATDILRNVIDPYKGKYLFLDFWATYCGPCRWGIENMRPIRDKYANNDKLDFIFITGKNDSPIKEYEKYTREQNIVHSYRLANDEFNYLKQLFRINGIPHYVLIDPEGRVKDFNFDMVFDFDVELKKILSED